MDDTVVLNDLASLAVVPVKALYLSERIDVRNLRAEGVVAKLPLTFRADGGYAVIFRYGAVVLFSVSAAGEKQLMERLKESLVNPFASPNSDEVEIRLDPATEEGVKQDAICVKELTLDRIQLIAEVLAKSVVLDYYEAAVELNTEAAEKAVVGLQKHGYRSLGMRELIRQISSSLLSLHETVGFVGISERPELLWDLPDRERFYSRLEDEYEIRERHLAIDKKVELIFRTAETLVNLQLARRSLRLEWSIVILIVFEVFLILYELWLKQPAV